LQLGAWFGLVAGLVEGCGLLATYGLGWLNDNIRVGVSIEILWISTLVSLLLFLTLALAVGLLRSLLPRLVVPQIILPLFLFLSFLDWTALSGRLGPIAVLVLSAGLATMAFRAISKRGLTGLPFFRRSLPWLVASAVVVFVAVHGGLWLRERLATRRLAAAPGSPNVVVVVVDTLRADHMSLYGYPRQTSPNIDSIAREGVVVDNAVATASWTLPSHASLLTGRYAHEHGAETDTPLNSRYPTLSETMRDHGYRTGGFSANLIYFTRRGNFDRGFLHFEDYFYSTPDEFYRTLWGRIFNRYIPDRLGWDEWPQGKRAEDVNREMLQWVDKDPGKPFFAFLNYFDVHTPYRPPAPYRGKFASTGKAGPSPDNRRSLSQEDLNVLRDSDPYLFRVLTSPDGFDQAVDAYDGSVAYVDAQIGRLFAELRQRGLDKNTVVIITSDHGEELLDHGMVHHRNALYRDLIWVPLIYWAPGRIPAGVHVSRPISAASLPATVLNLIGDGAQTTFPVPSLAQLWQHPDIDPAWPDPISELHRYIYLPHDYPAHEGWMKAIIGPRWQLIVSEKLPAELYDWQTDPREQSNLATDPANSSVVDDLNSELWNEVRPGANGKQEASDDRPSRPTRSIN
jgi:arylsulfatase A-like enzyme